MYKTFNFFVILHNRKLKSLTFYQEYAIINCNIIFINISVVSVYTDNSISIFGMGGLV